MNLVAGLYNNEQIWLDDVHEASVVETSSVDDCVLKVKQLAPDLTLCIGHKHISLLSGSIMISFCVEATRMHIFEVRLLSTLSFLSQVVKI